MNCWIKKILRSITRPSWILVQLFVNHKIHFVQICVQAKNCQAYQQGWTNKLPLKTKPQSRKTRWFYYFIVEAGKDKIWIRERTGKDIWQNLYEFVLWETGKIIPQEKLQQSPFFQETFRKSGISDTTYLASLSVKHLPISPLQAVSYI